MLRSETLLNTGGAFPATPAISSAFSRPCERALIETSKATAIWRGTKNRTSLAGGLLNIACHASPIGACQIIGVGQESVQNPVLSAVGLDQASSVAAIIGFGATPWPGFIRNS
jgi:hypothetical protein